jgi:hypothetical protein
MTEPPALPPSETQAEPALQPPPQQVAKPGRLPWFSAAGFLILAAAIFWVWQHPISQPPAPTQPDTQVQQLAALDARVARLEQRPVPQATDLGPLTARMAALEQRPPATPAPPSSGQAPDLAPLEARIAALEAKQPSDNRLAGKIGALSAHTDALEATERGVQSDLSRRLDADGARLATLERTMGQTSEMADRTTRTARIQAAHLALDAGEKLGDIPGAPQALARFANTAPPTEAGLRLAFPRAAHEALAAAQPTTDGRPLLARVWAEAQDLVIIRRGDRVLVGDPTAGVLEHVRVALDAGDLAGAVAAVASLDGAAVQAMADWLAKARALLEARAALLDWAAHA